MDAIGFLKEEGISVAVKTPVMKENAGEIDDLRKMMASMEIDHIASPLIFPKDDGGRAPLCHRPDNEQLKKFFKSCEVKDLTERQGAYSCHLGRCTLSIRANGEATPCICVPFPVGHVAEEPLEDIWTKSERLINIRQKTEEPLPECKDCDLKNWCFRCEGLAFTEGGKLFGCSEELYRMAKARKEACYAGKEAR
jgi:radical SAM protein with 4Fe4S-binding SPASM domain